MMIAEDVVLPGVIVTVLEADVCKIVFGSFLGTYPVETTEMRGLVAMWLGATVVTLKRDIDGSSLAWKLA